jgi:DNA mismatch repair protein MutS
VSLAWAIAEHLHDRLGCRALFATHYHELARLADRLPGLRNYNVLVEEGGGDIVFLHRIAPGSADKSYGLHVARLAGVPGEVLERAQQVLGELEARPLDGEERPRKRAAKRPGPAAQPSLLPARKNSVA